MKDFLNEEIEPGDILLKTKSKGILYLLVFRGSCTNSGMLRVFEFYGLKRNGIEGIKILHSYTHPDNIVKISEDKFKELVDDNLIMFLKEGESEEVKDEILKLSQKIKNKFL